MGEKITEQPSEYRHLEHMTINEVLHSMNREDERVPKAVHQAIPQIEKLVEHIASRMSEGGRLLYIGAGTSGRLGVVDASEIPPTFGAPPDWVIGIIAGGDRAIRQPVEYAEDSEDQAWEDLRAWKADHRDVVLGIAASGTTPYVVSGLRACRRAGITTGCITCNPDGPVIQEADFPVVVVTGPEFVTGSTRLKAGTAQKLVLNMISTAVMIRLGRVRDNRMVDMQITNQKLIDRGARMVAEALGLTYEVAREHLLKHGSVRRAIEAEED